MGGQIIPISFVVNKLTLEYAKMLQTAHGNNAVAAMQLGQKIKVTPKDTQAVDALRVKGAGELAMLVPLEGATFQKAYLSAMIKGHEEALDMYDDLMKNADNADLKKLLVDTRKEIAEHLEKAKQLQAN